MGQAFNPQSTITIGNKIYIVQRRFVGARPLKDAIYAVIKAKTA